MELITLCGLAIVVFGLWVEFALAVKAGVKIIRNCRLVKDAYATRGVQQPVYMSRMPICLTKLSHY